MNENVWHSWLFYSQRGVKYVKILFILIFFIHRKYEDVGLWYKNSGSIWQSKSTRTEVRAYYSSVPTSSMLEMMILKEENVAIINRVKGFWRDLSNY